MSLINLGILILATLLHCGHASPRIAGAQNGTISQFPFLAQLHRRLGNSDDFEYYCTGALVSTTRLVTAAHCFHGIYYNHPSQWKIRVGATNHVGAEDQAYSVDPTQIIIHEDYNSENFDNDLAVVTWQFPFWPSSLVNFIELNDVPVPAYSQVTIAGWGGVDKKGIISESLQYANIPTIELQVCRINYAWHSRFVTDNMMCAGTAGRGSCINDRGLPLIYNNRLAGVSSWRLSCGEIDRPGVFAVVLDDNAWLSSALEL